MSDQEEYTYEELVGLLVRDVTEANHCVPKSEIRRRIDEIVSSGIVKIHDDDEWGFMSEILESFGNPDIPIEVDSEGERRGFWEILNMMGGEVTHSKMRDGGFTYRIKRKV